jgi:hypothetical protein
MKVDMLTSSLQRKHVKQVELLIEVATLMSLLQKKHVKQVPAAI